MSLEAFLAAAFVIPQNVGSRVSDVIHRDALLITLPVLHRS